MRQTVEPLYNLSDSFDEPFRPQSKGDIDRRVEELKKKGRHFTSRDELRDFTSEKELKRKHGDDSDLNDIAKDI